MRCPVLAVAVAASLAMLSQPVIAQTAQAPRSDASTAKPVTVTARAGAPVIPEGITPPADYVIGNDDVLTVVFWRDKDMSTEVSVRPDGKISLPLLNDVQAAGLTPDELRANLSAAANKFIEDPTVSVVVKTINSRRVFITGQVGKPGTYPLLGSTTVLQLIAMAGGVGDYADSKKIQIIRNDSNGKATSRKFNYQDFIKGKNVAQNIELKPGDTVVVP